MPAPDLAAILAALPPLTFAPAAEVPVSRSRWYLVAPANDEWCIARREDERGWFNDQGSLIDEPLVCAVLPPAPGHSIPRMIRGLAKWVADAIEDGDYATAATAIDELADWVRAARDRP